MEFIGQKGECGLEEGPGKAQRWSWRPGEALTVRAPWAELRRRGTRRGARPKQRPEAGRGIPTPGRSGLGADERGKARSWAGTDLERPRMTGQPAGLPAPERSFVCFSRSSTKDVLHSCLRPDPVLDTEETARKNGQIPGLLERRGWPGRETVLMRTRKGNGGRSPRVPGRDR